MLPLCMMTGIQWFSIVSISWTSLCYQSLARCNEKLSQYFQFSTEESVAIIADEKKYAFFEYDIRTDINILARVFQIQSLYGILGPTRYTWTCMSFEYLNLYFSNEQQSGKFVCKVIL